MFSKTSRLESRRSRIRRVRAKISGTALRPRLAVFRSLAHITAQLIDDETGTTLAAVTDRGLTGTGVEKATQVGQKIAEAAKQHKIETVVFDRGGFLYHGRVAALAESARQSGLKF